jgi:hypothetical protein
MNNNNVSQFVVVNQQEINKNRLLNQIALFDEAGDSVELGAATTNTNTVVAYVDVPYNNEIVPEDFGTLPDDVRVIHITFTDQDRLNPWEAEKEYAPNVTIQFDYDGTAISSWTASPAYHVMQAPISGWLTDLEAQTALCNTFSQKSVAGELYMQGDPIDMDRGTFRQVAPNRVWTAEQSYSLLEVIYANGSAWVCTSAGTSDVVEPSFPSVPDYFSPPAAITDGTTEWTYWSHAFLFSEGGHASNFLDTAQPTTVIGPAGTGVVTWYSNPIIYRTLLSGGTSPAFDDENEVYVDGEIKWTAGQSVRMLVNLDSLATDGRTIRLVNGYTRNEARYVSFSDAKFIYKQSVGGAIEFVYRESTDKWMAVGGYWN